MDNSELEVITQSLIDCHKQISSQSKSLTKICKERDGTFKDLEFTSKILAQSISKLEDTAKKIRAIDTAQIREIESSIKLIYEISISSKGRLLGIIKQVKNSHDVAASSILGTSPNGKSGSGGYSISSLEDKIVNFIQESAQVINQMMKNMAPAVEAMKVNYTHRRSFKIKLRGRKGTGGNKAMEEVALPGDSTSTTVADLPMIPQSSSAPPNMLKIIHEASEIIVCWGDQLLHVMKMPSNSSNGPDLENKFKNSLKTIEVHMDKLLDIAKDYDLPKEKKKLESNYTDFSLRAQQVFDLQGQASNKDILGLEIAKVKLEESVWWFELLVERLETQNANEPVQDSPRMNSFIANSPSLARKESRDFEDPTSPSQHKAMVQVGFPLSDMVKTVIVKEKQTADNFLESVYEKYYATKFPNKPAKDFVFKMAATSLYVEGDIPFLSHPFIRDLCSNQRKISLIIIERIDREMKEIPEVILKAEKMDTGKDLINSVYTGEFPEQLKMYEKNGKEVLATMIVYYDIKASAMKDLFNDDSYIQRHQGLKSKFGGKTNAQKLFESLEEIINQTFDQYEGLRQITDFRSISEIGDLIIREGQAINNLFKKMMVSAQIVITEQYLDSGALTPVDQSVIRKFEETSKQLLGHFYCFKTGILNKLKFVSSIREKIGSSNMNASYGRLYMKEVLDVTIVYVKDTKKLFEDKIRELEKLPIEIQTRVYQKFQGPLRFDMEAEKNFSQIRPLVEQSIKLQLISIVQREVFAKNRQELENMLEGNKNIMLAGFKEMLSSKLLEPTVQLDELLKAFSDEIDVQRFAWM